MRYLAVTRGCEDHWYPSDLRKRAVVNHYLDEHHNFIREGVGVYVYKKLFSPLITGRTYADSELEECKNRLVRGLALMEARLSKHRYLCGEQISIADLSAACELERSRFINLDMSHLIPYPKVKAWLFHVVDENPTLLEIEEKTRNFARRWKENLIEDEEGKTPKKT